MGTAILVVTFENMVKSGFIKNYDKYSLEVMRKQMNIHSGQNHDPFVVG